jgi:hypothetical protein
MKSTSLCLSLAAALTAAVPAFAKIERTIEKTFVVQSGGTLSVSTQGGDVRVQPGAGTEVRVKAVQVFPKAKTDAEADEILKGLEFSVEQSGSDVKAVAKYEKSRMGGWGTWPPVQVSFVVTVPSAYNVDLSTSGGDLVVGDLSGAAKLRTSGGDIQVAKLSGPVEGSTSGGDIEVAGASGKVRLSTSGGDIRVSATSGDTEVSTSGGDIEVTGVSGKLSASTSGGDVRATLSGPLTADCSLGTSGGDVVVKGVATSGLYLDASTSGGDVEATGLTITIEKGGVGKNRLAGKVNGGGPTLKLRTSGGDIDVRP